MMTNKSITVLAIIAMMVVSTGANMLGKDMATCSRNAKGLCKCDSKDAFGATCRMCKSDAACGATSKCRTSALALDDEVTGWCSIKDEKAVNFIDGVPFMEMRYDNTDGSAVLDVYRENENNKFNSLFTCDLSSCSQVEDRKNSRVFTKCLNVNECRATCSVGKKSNHWCKNVVNHFEEQKRAGFVFNNNKQEQRVKIICKNGNKCTLDESYGLMPEFSTLKNMDCTFGQCVNSENANFLRRYD